jgi:hypothetical protein
MLAGDALLLLMLNYDIILLSERSGREAIIAPL